MSNCPTLQQAMTLVQIQQRLFFMEQMLREMERVYGANLDCGALTIDERAELIQSVYNISGPVAYHRQFIQRRIEAIASGFAKSHPQVMLDGQDYQRIEVELIGQGIDPKEPIEVKEAPHKR